LLIKNKNILIDATYLFQLYTYLLRGGEPVGSQELDISFDQIYNQTYKKALHYVTARCGNPSDITDILQEIYAELYRVLVRRGMSYIQQPEAFVMQLAKSKVYRYYTISEKIKNMLPFSTVGWNREDGSTDVLQVADEDFELNDMVADRILLRQIADFVKSKPEDVQRIFYLYYVLEQPSAQIALDLQINESTVKSKIHRTVHEVRTLYGKVGKEQ
jgi:RNA polymerase sigma factor (sigma-70 family)